MLGYSNGPSFASSASYVWSHVTRLVSLNREFWMDPEFGP